MMDIAADAAGDAHARRGIAMANGVRYVYTGNVHDARGQSTYCPGCGDGSSSATGTSWATGGSTTTAAARRAAPRARAVRGAPGHWGARRQPVRLAGDDR